MEEDDILAKGSVKDHFAESDEVLALISDIPNVIGNQILTEISLEKFTFIVDSYQEQPHLLDPYLENFLRMLLKYIHVKESPETLLHVFKFMHLLTKLRGHKRIVRLFPHEVADLEPIMTLLSEQDPLNRETWEVKYMLLLWLSMICLIPFDIKKFDSEKKSPLMERIIETGKLYLMLTADNCQIAASILLAKLLTRPDAQYTQLPKFVDWCLEKMSEVKDDYIRDIVTLTGPLMALALIFSIGSRDATIKFATKVLDQVLAHNLNKNQNSVVRKLCVKLTQRIGMTFLKPVVPKWRYNRGCRSLEESLKQQTKGEDIIMEKDEEDEYDIPEEIESVIELLLNALYDSDTIVRWSAAKGIGRITSRLPRDLADEVIGSVIDCFTDLQADGAWHGGCLTLAELGRRGLLLPDRLKDVVPLLLRALIYDIKRGACSVGAHVRDSACYLAWSFARSYTPAVIKDYVESIARTLLVVTSYDREVNCRRAASAAFQENVGRQGTFPHGIDILTKADYFAVGSRSNAYLTIAPYIAGFREYTLAFVNHLCERKIDHWDPDIRWLTADALHELVKINPLYFSTDILEKLIPACIGIDLNARHGSIIALAEVVHALFEMETKSFHSGIISKSKLLKDILAIGQQLKDGNLLRGHGNELMRVAFCHLAARLSQCRDVIKPPKKITECWLEIIHDTLSNLHLYGDVEAVCDAAVKALAEINHITMEGSQFVELASNQGAESNSKIDEVLDGYLSMLKSTTERQRCGYSQAVAAFPKPVLKGRFTRICDALVAASKITGEADTFFADSRMHAINALVKICQGIEIVKGGNPNDSLCSQNVNKIYRALLDSLKDYTKDSRGDVGSIVRLAGIRGICSVTLLLAEKQPDLLTEDNVRRFMCAVLQQACEKMHKVRDTARDTLYSFLHSTHTVLHIPYHEELKIIFQNPKAMPGMKDFFQLLSKVLVYDVYLYHMLLGMIISVGDLTQSLADASGEALCAHLETIRKDEVQLLKFCSTLIEIFENNLKVARVTIPMLKTLQLILQKDFFSIITDMMVDSNRSGHELTKFPAQLLELVKKEILRTKDATRLFSSIEVFSGILQFPSKELRKNTISKLVRMLCHPFPKIRRLTATQLYEAVLTFEDLVEEENMDTVLAILSETVWDDPVTSLRPIRNDLCPYFQVAVPELKKTVA